MEVGDGVEYYWSDGTANPIKCSAPKVRWGGWVGLGLGRGGVNQVVFMLLLNPSKHQMLSSKGEVRWRGMWWAGVG